jgi:hypothetical protein
MLGAAERRNYAWLFALPSRRPPPHPHNREIPQNAKKPAGQRQPGGLSRLVSYEIMEAYFARDLRSPGPTSLAGRDTEFLRDIALSP